MTPVGVCPGCGRPRETAESYYASLDVLATVDTVFDETGHFHNLESARAALGRIHRSWKLWRKAHHV